MLQGFENNQHKIHQHKNPNIKATGIKDMFVECLWKLRPERFISFLKK
jgi:hypothetical protein